MIISDVLANKYVWGMREFHEYSGLNVLKVLMEEDDLKWASHSLFPRFIGGVYH